MEADSHCELISWHRYARLCQRLAREICTSTRCPDLIIALGCGAVGRQGRSDRIVLVHGVLARCWKRGGAMKELKERITRLERHQRRLHWMLVSLTILVFLIGMLIYSRAF